MKFRPFQRQDRFGHELYKVLSEIFLKEIDTTQLGFVTITHVKTSRDLKLARVYVSVLERKVKKEEVEKFFKKNRGVIRKTLGSMIHSKVVPDLTFHYDERYEEVERINRLFLKIRAKG